MKYYKFISLAKLERFIDILINTHLYASCYRDLNDPFEGHFDWKSIGKDLKNGVFSTMYNARICSLQAAKEPCPTNVLMWSHYADSHNGCCLKVSVDSYKGWELLPVNYSQILPKVEGSDVEKITKDIFSHKTIEWSKENEVRFVKFFDKKPKDKVYLKVKIEAIYFGQNIKAEERWNYAKLVKKIDPSIEVFVMKEMQNEDYFPSLSAIPYSE